MADSLMPQNAQRLVIYIGEADRWRGAPLYAALLETLRVEGLAGATVVRGVAGFGAHSRIHTAAIVRLSEDLPLRVEVIDTAEKIAHALEKIGPMVSEGLITLDEVHVVKYTHRYLNPLPADRPVSDVMTRQVVTLSPEMSVSEAWQKMLESLRKALPVVDGQGHVVGLLTDEDILTRVGLGQRLSVAKRLDPDLLRQELESLQASPLKVQDVMSQPAITAQANEPLGVAAARMAKAGIKRLPVLDKNGRLVGVLSRVDVLHQVSDAHAKAPPKGVLPGAAQRVSEIMLPEIPIVRANADLTEIVRAFIEANTHRLIVVDEEGRPLGLLSDADAITRVQPPQRRGVLDALRRASPPPAAAVTARDLMSPEVLSIAADRSLAEAAQQMLAAGRKWMIVVDEKGHPLGLVDRQVLLKAVGGQGTQNLG